MPKRDAKYMSEQRSQIAAAAFDCILENGVHNTSLRDVCLAAGVSMGALYIHFDNKDDLIDAAIIHLNEQNEMLPPVSTWTEYEEHLILQMSKLDLPYEKKLLSLTFQLYSERVKDPKKTPLMYDTYSEIVDWLEMSLDLMHKNKEITLPLGLGVTTKALMSLTYGTFISSSVIPFLDQEQHLQDILISARQIVGKEE